MKIAVIGCGAMGSIYAGLLASNGHDVLAVDFSAAHVKAINANGLRVSGASGDRTVALRAFTGVPANETADLVVLAVKSAAAGAAAQSASALVGPDTVVIAIQNGLGAEDDIVESIDPDRLIVGIAGGFGGSLEGPGHAHHNGMKVIRFGAFASLSFDVVKQMAAAWEQAGFSTEAVSDIVAMKWGKLICNVAYSGPCALAGMSVGEAMDDPELGPVSRMAASEAHQIAMAQNIVLPFDDPVEHVRAFAAGMPAARPSTLQDLEAGRRSEIDYINGAVGRKAREIGMTAPVNDTLTHLVKVREQQSG